MSDSKPVISPENVPTLAAVSMILGLLSLVFGFYLHRQIMESAVMSGALDVRAAKRDIEISKDITALKDRIAALEAAKPAADATAATAADPAAAPATPPQ